MSTLKAIIRWGTGAVLSALGFQLIYSLLFLEWELI
jgi:hypothetical protein